MLSAALALTIVGAALFALNRQGRTPDKDTRDLAPVRVRTSRPRVERRRPR